MALVKTSMEHKGYRVLTSLSGAQLFSLLEKEKPDAIVLDIMMPQMDGLEVLVRLKNTPSTSSIPVILLTAKVQYEDVLEGYSKGANGYVTKPFTSAQLFDAIKRVLGEAKKP